ncbi:MAG: Fic family protein [bacterium]|nr:Fic family protein [bacterium]
MTNYINRYKQQMEYQSFYPAMINRPVPDFNREVDLLLSTAMLELGKLEAYSQLVPDINYFIKMHVTKEANTSNRIEGTRTEIDEIFLPKEDISDEKKDDWQEVQNYINALEFSLKELNSRLPLSMRLLKETHQKLLVDVRGKYRHPGEIRISQNWIGGSSLKDAFFIPPHPDDLSELLTDLEKFWHNQELQIPDLIKIAISHYQFETIHPFLDGNGRLGRLLIVLQLIENRILTYPTLYLSAFFEKNKGAYYDSLTMARQTADLNQWLRFFLSGVIETARNSIVTFQKIIKLRKVYQERIMIFNGNVSQNANTLINTMFTNPIVNTEQVMELLDCSWPAANNLITRLIKLDILREKTGFKRNRTYELYAYLELFK